MSAPQELRKSILIVKSQQKGLTAVETFLKNRDWHIYTTAEIKDALTFIIKHKPSFVMISMDHPNKKVRQMPKLLASAFPVHVIAFSESNTTQAYKNLLDSGCNYRINPPVTGPAVERTINKIIRDQQQAEEEARRAAAAGSHSHGSSAEGGNIVLKGERGESDQASGPVNLSGGDEQERVTGVVGGDSNQHSPAYMPSQKIQSANSILKHLNDGDAQGENLSEADVLSVVGDGSDLPGDAAPVGRAPGLLRAEDLTQGEADGEVSGEMPSDQAGALVSQGTKKKSSKKKSRKGEPETLSTGSESRPEGEPAAFVGGEVPSGSPETLDGGSPVESGGGEPAALMSVGQSASVGDGPLIAEGGQSAPSEMPGVYIAKGERAQMHSAVADGAGAGELMQATQEEMKDRAAGPHFLGSDMIGQAHEHPGGDKQKNPETIGHAGGGDAPAMPGTLKAKNTARPEAQYAEEDILDTKAAPGPAPIVDPSRVKPKAEPAAIERDRASKAPETQTHASLNSEVHKVTSKVSGWQKQDNIVVRGAHQAMEESVTLKEGGKVEQKLEQSSNVACIVVESARFSGYLVAAMGKNHKIDAKFMKVIKDRLYKFLSDNGEKVNEEEQMGIKIKQVDFEDWAVEYADFLRKSVHEGQEIAMAFFPFTDAKTQIAESAAADMGAVKIDDLKGDLAVDFNVYVYLPANKKYVLYTPRGSKFYGNQKDRLSTMGVTHLHVKRTELMDVSKYRAQNYLNSKIAEYEAKKKGQKSA